MMPMPFLYFAADTPSYATYVTRRFMPPLIRRRAIRLFVAATDAASLIFCAMRFY